MSCVLSCTHNEELEGVTPEPSFEILTSLALDSIWTQSEVSYEVLVNLVGILYSSSKKSSLRRCSSPALLRVFDWRGDSDQN